MVADLHWGKAEIFQQAGIPVSSQTLDEDLAILGRLIRDSGAEKVLLLGDLIHGKSGLTTDLKERVSRWRQSIDAKLTLIAGNHDRHVAALPPSWDMEILRESYDEGPFHFAHHPAEEPGRYTWCGHLHPTVVLGRRLDRMRLACFWLQPRCGVLPSFGSFTGGAVIRPGSKDQVYAIAEEQVIALHREEDAWKNQTH